MVDSHSKSLEVFHMTSTTSSRTIEVLRNLFAAHGLLEEVVSDNGPQFASSDFKQFLAKNIIKQTLVPPYHPASNGAAERSVLIFKCALVKQVLDASGQASITLQHRLSNFLSTRATSNLKTWAPRSKRLRNPGPRSSYVANRVSRIIFRIRFQ